jgi:hypothetical protein
MSAPKDLKMIKYHGYWLPQSKSCAVGPYFFNEIQRRIQAKMATNIIFVGEPGISKSYLAIDTARIIEGRYKTADGKWKDRFDISQVVFTFSEFMKLVLHLKSGKVIVLDEPSFAVGHRDWHKKVNQILTKTIESFRFKVHPLFLPIANAALLDRTIREHLLQFMVVVKGRGEATVYRLIQSQFKDKTYHENFCEIKQGMLDADLCNKDSCLDCNKLKDCRIFRAQYERKKAMVQDKRYAESKEQAEKTESKKLSLLELEKIAKELRALWFINGKINVQRLRVALQDVHAIQISTARAYQLKAALEAHN